MKGKVTEIAQAWINVAVGNKEIKALAKERLAVCNSCPSKIYFINIEACGECHCPLLGKTHSPENSCDLKKWKR